MNEEIKRAIDDFVSEFKSLDVVKNYVLLKRSILEDEDFLNLKEKHKNAQKELALSFNKDDYEQKKEEFERIDELYQNHPYVMNMKGYEEEIHELLKEIEIKLK